MKSIHRSFIVAFFSYWLFCVVIGVGFKALYGKQIIFDEVVLYGLAMSITMVGLFYALLNVSLKPKFQFLESNSSQLPNFGHQIATSIELDPRQSFEDVVSKISQLWLISDVDYSAHIVKFRQRIGFSSWGIGATLWFDLSNGKASLICFPLFGYTNKSDQLAKDMSKEIEHIFLGNETEI